MILYGTIMHVTSLLVW